MPNSKSGSKLQELLNEDLSKSEKKITRISDLKDNVGKEVFVRGWVYRQRGSTNLAFVLIRDGTGVVQCAIKSGDVSEDTWKDANDVFLESVVYAYGTVAKEERAPGGYEIRAKELKVEFRGEAFPIGKDQSTEFLLDVRHLWVRSQAIINALKMKAFVMRTAREFLDEKGFIEIQTPIFTSSAAEGGATVFEVTYFGGKAYLAQTGQLYSEALIEGYPLVYVFAPSFRAEPSRTPRHLTEFWQLEPEMAFYNQRMNMELQGELVERICHEVARKQTDILQKFKRDPKDLLGIKAPFESMTYAKAIEELQKKGLKIKWGDGIGLDEEKILVQENTQPVFLTNQPKEMRAFYMKINPDDPRTVLDGDLLAPEGIGEIIGGSERVSDYDELVKRLKEMKLKEKDYKWYVELRKYGSVPHSGFGMGSERLIRWLLKLESIRDAIPFPRTMNRLEP
jgi:asparaginyl-tRNA synthetase